MIGGSGSGKTRFYVKPNLMQMPQKVSYVLTDPKGTIIIECGKMLSDAGYKIKVLNTINFKKSMGESQTVKTMIHEVAHAMLHNSDFMKQHGEEKDRLTKETEAESIAFTVCSALGIDTSDYSFPYVASWASGKEMKELKDSMDTIRLTAADFLEKLEAAVAERSAERMTAMQYAEKLIADREQEKTIFDDEQRNLIVNFAFKLDDRAATEELVNGLAAALAEDDKEERGIAGNRNL